MSRRHSTPKVQMSTEIAGSVEFDVGGENRDQGHAVETAAPLTLPDDEFPERCGMMPPESLFLSVPDNFVPKRRSFIGRRQLSGEKPAERRAGLPAWW